MGVGGQIEDGTYRALLAERDELAERVLQLTAIIDGESVPASIRQVLSPLQRRIFATLVRRPSGALGSDLRNAMYFDRPDGGPDSPNIIFVHLNHLRRKLAKVGLEIETVGEAGPVPHRYLLTSRSRVLLEVAKRAEAA